MSDAPAILKTSANQFIAYHKSQGKENMPTIVFLGGLMSDMQGTKALALEEHCKKNDLSYLRFDYTGHGQSSGKFTDGTISIWRDDVLAAIDQLTSGDLILVGSSLGGWLMLLAALMRKDRVVAIVGIASAPDFTEDLIWQKMTKSEQEQLTKNGLFDLASDYDDRPYPITKALIEDGRNNLLLNDKIEINCPVRLIHGMIDEDVPCDVSVKLSEQLTTDNICLNLVPNGDHRMSTDENIKLICETLDELLRSFEVAILLRTDPIQGF